MMLKCRLQASWVAWAWGRKLPTSCGGAAALPSQSQKPPSSYVFSGVCFPPPPCQRRCHLRLYGTPWSISGSRCGSTTVPVTHCNVKRSFLMPACCFRLIGAKILAFICLAVTKRTLLYRGIMRAQCCKSLKVLSLQERVGNPGGEEQPSTTGRPSVDESGDLSAGAAETGHASIEDLGKQQRELLATAVDTAILKVVPEIWGPFTQCPNSWILKEKDALTKLNSQWVFCCGIDLLEHPLMTGTYVWKNMLGLLSLPTAWEMACQIEIKDANWHATWLGIWLTFCFDTGNVGNQRHRSTAALCSETQCHWSVSWRVSSASSRQILRVSSPAAGKRASLSSTRHPQEGLPKDWGSACCPTR